MTNAVVTQSGRSDEPGNERALPCPGCGSLGQFEWRVDALVPRQWSATVPCAMCGGRGHSGDVAPRPADRASGSTFRQPSRVIPPERGVFSRESLPTARGILAAAGPRVLQATTNVTLRPADIPGAHQLQHWSRDGIGARWPTD